jgi:hypothetical protein
VGEEEDQQVEFALVRLIGSPLMVTHRAAVERSCRRR